MNKKKIRKENTAEKEKSVSCDNYCGAQTRTSHAFRELGGMGLATEV